MSDISDDFERRHRKNLKNYKQRIEDIYHEAIEKLTRSAAGNALPSGTFNLAKLPVLNNRVNEVLAQMKVNVQTTIVNGISTEWDLSNAKNNVYVDKRMSTWLKSVPQGAVFYDPNTAARDAFARRQVKGLNLSDRVWNSVDHYRRELEAGVGLGIASGKSATSMATDLKKYLDAPDQLFRRIKSLDKNGDAVFRLSKAALSYNPGQGVYRSSYKNALRLTGTETNMAYRTADHVRWKTLPFVVGQEIRLSNQHPQYDICDRCAGRYPKEFIFIGWHPQCICYKVPIMMTDEEYEKYEDALIEGKNPRVRSTEKVTDVPKGFRDYVNEHADNIKGLKSQPYWVRDNFKNGNITKELKFPTKADSLIVTSNYILDPAALTRLKDSGVNFENEPLITAAFNSKMKGFNMEELFTDFDEIGKENGITWTKKNVVGTGRDQGVFLITRHIGTSSAGEVYIERNFKTINGKTEVYHAYFKIPEKLQGNGISKRVLSSYYEQYRKAGISKITVTANIDVGGYAWANYGFSATNMTQVIDMLSEQASFISDDQNAIIRKLVRAHYEKDRSVPFPMKRIADLGKLDGSAFGKKFLLGTYWSGELNLADKATRSIFEDYLYGKKKKK